MIPDALLQLGPAALAALVLALVTPALIRIDLAEHRLPNRLVGVAAAGLVPALAWRWLLDGSAPIAPLLFGVAAGFAYLLLAIGGGMGMGDAKLAAVLGGGAALASPLAAIAGIMLAFLLGGCAAAVVLVRRAIRRRGRLAPAPAAVAELVPALAPTPAATPAPAPVIGSTAEAEAEAAAAGTHPARIAFGPWMLLGHWTALVLWLASELGALA